MMRRRPNGMIDAPYSRNRLGPFAFFSTIRTWLVYLVAATVLGAAIGFGVAMVTPATYASQVTLLITPVASQDQITFSDIEVAQALAPTFSELATTTPVLQRVIASTGTAVTTDKLAREIETRVPAGTSLIDVTVNDANPTTAAAFANAIAAELVAYPTSGLTSQPAGLRVALTVVDPALPPAQPSGPGILLRTIFGAFVSLFLTLSFVFGIENLRSDRRGRSVEGRGGPESASPKMTPDESEADLVHRRAGGLLGSLPRPVDPGSPSVVGVIRAPQTAKGATGAE
jgi:capsular polysaccharide biosynthesis protein